MYKNYIFDLYGTLVNIETNEKLDKVWDKLSKFYSYNKALYNTNEIRNKYDSLINKYKNLYASSDYPDFPIEYVFEELYLLKNVIPTQELIINTALFFRVLTLNKLEVYDGIIDLLDTLKKYNKNIYLLTNAQKIFTSCEIELLGLKDYFNGILYSSELKMCKPNIKIFNELINNYNLDITETVMIGNDYFCDMIPARKINMDTLYIQTNLSPKVKKTLNTNYKILNGNHFNIKSLIL